MKTFARATYITGAVVIVLVIAALTVAFRPDRPTAPDPSQTVGALPAARSNSHVLDDAGPDAPTLVEFLDFECEACGAFYPLVEQLRGKYAGKVNYVVRYFPLPGHVNAMNAALAAEAAAQQGQFESMYRQLFKTQKQWGEQQVPDPGQFRAFAEDLGLNMEDYDRAVAAPATWERVEQDVNDGKYLGATGTPTFFLDGKKLELTGPADLTAALDAVLAR
ncbi:thioredoxin domain-containing protein [Tersicoccus sp. Bi-70]|uniref:DsbA family protein n=1 Tax=Tersicoccus sp. Bi-70 TaxID=1897634 RepID=UPI0009F8CB29|nr:thioredoxin domain-containing protein [Tersicoccus sp. Bi-70]